jgi:glycosyltransferase involved in cell wall biosynthesis
MDKSYKEPLVSICCLTYNHGPYIHDAIEGFLIQKTSFPFEILIHDDASTDGTADIISEYEAKYPDIIKPIYQKENQYSKGIKINATYQFPRARGKYIALCEGDDYWTDAKKLQMQVDFLESNPEFSMCFHNALVIYQDLDKSPHRFNHIEKSQEIDLETLIDDWIVPTASILFRKSILPIPDWANQIYSGDMTLALIAYDKGKIFFINEMMSVYRKLLHNKDSLSTKMGEMPIFVLEQHLLLYSLYNEYTGLRYDKVLKKKIKYLKKQIKYLHYKKISFFLPFILLPIFMVKKVLWKILFLRKALCKRS